MTALAPPGLVEQPKNAAPSPLKRYRAVLAEVRRERGEVCEACRAPARSGHHLAAVGLTGIASELVFEPGNIAILCNTCHAACHPLRRSYDWLDAAKRRSKALTGGRSR